LTAAKCAVAAGILGWMAQSGKLNVAMIAAGARRWPDMLLIAGTLIVALLLAAVRWHVLLLGQQFHMPFRQTVALTRIGLLFNAVLPGAVSGDVVKAYYVAQDVGRDRVRVVTTIIVDRLLGLFSLTLVASVGVLFNGALVRRNPTLLTVSTMTLGACAALGAGVAAAIFASHGFVALAAWIERRVRWLGFLKHAASAIAAYRSQGRRIVAGVLLSVPIHLLACFGIFVALRAVNGTHNLSGTMLLFLVPLGFVPMSLPIAPAGVGVGQAALYAIFEMAVRGSGESASSALTLYQAILLLLYLTGLWPYLRRRKPVADAVSGRAARVQDAIVPGAGSPGSRP